jgi:hypothetical protein
MTSEGNIGWDAVKDSVSNLTFFQAQEPISGSMISVSTGIDRDDLK